MRLKRIRRAFDDSIASSPDNGKPTGRWRRKATGPSTVDGDGSGRPGYLEASPRFTGQGPRAATGSRSIHCHHRTEGATPMLELLRKRREDDEGFTLIELMVVVMIIAILIAIAIPTFLGARQRAQDRAAQSNVRNAFTAEKTFYTDGQAYTGLVSDMTAIEPSLTYTTTAGSLAASGNLVFLAAS